MLVVPDALCNAIYNDISIIYNHLHKTCKHSYDPVERTKRFAENALEPTSLRLELGTKIHIARRRQ